MERAYATLAVKSFTEDGRGYSFAGLATSPVPDRVADRIDPLGAKYKNPVCLLRAHDHLMPIGECTFGRPSKAGIGFDANIPKISEPGLLKDRLDMAAGEVRAGLMRGVSIGFRPIKDPKPNELGGWDYPSVEIYELSTCAVPMHQLATIDTIKAIDAAVREGGQPATIEGKSSESGGALWRRISAAGLRAMDEYQLSNECKQLGPIQGVQVASARSLQEMVKGLCHHIEDLERHRSESPLQYRGVWKGDHTFPANSFVTFNGCVWHTEKATDRKPGEGDWVMAVKKGRDGRDAGR